MTQTTPKIAFIKARWHAEIVDRAEEGFLAAAPKLMPGSQVTTFTVPGAFEMPLIAKKLAQTGKFDAIVAAAFVVNGGIYHHEFVSEAVVTGLMNVGLETGTPCFSVSLTPHNYQPVAELTEFYIQHFFKKGEEAASAVAQTLAVSAEIAALTAS